MSDHASFLAAITTAPADDLPRLVYADWLDEQGQHERAEFIRVSCACDGAPKRPGTGDIGFKDWKRQTERQAELWDGHRQPWFPLPPVEAGWNLCCGAMAEAEVSVGQPVAVVRRGFITEVHCRLADWIGGPCERCDGDGMEHDAPHVRQEHPPCPVCHGTGTITARGREILAAHPVEFVALIDTNPHQQDEPDGGLAWYDGDYLDPATPGLGELRGDLFAFLWELFPEARRQDEYVRWVRFDTAGQATAAVSAACISFARSPARSGG